MTVTVAAKTAKQQAAEAEALAIATARVRAGLCSKDIYMGFNSRRGCALTANHAGRCA